jgi:hypothetical protein
VAQEQFARRSLALFEKPLRVVACPACAELSVAMWLGNDVIAAAWFTSRKSALRPSAAPLEVLVVGDRQMVVLNELLRLEHGV